MGARAQPSLHLPISQERFSRLWGHWCLPLASPTTRRLLLWKQESSKWWTHPDHVYHPTTAEGEHLVDDGLSREMITRGTSRVRRKHWASAAFARLRSSLDERQISASKHGVCKQPKLEGSRTEGTFFWLAAGSANRCCSRKSASTSSQSDNSQRSSRRHESSETNREGATTGSRFIGSQTKISLSS